MYSAESEVFSRCDRVKVWLIGWIGYFVIGVVGRTMRWQSVGDSYLDEIYKSGNRAIFTFWHGRIFPATYYWRDRGIVVMTSKNHDGDLGAQRRAANFQIRRGRDTAFTIDGPRGPRYVAKQGPVLLALKTGAAIFCFHISMEHKVQLKSWDEFQVPLPFTRAVVLKASPIWVPPDASEEHLRDIHQQMQAALDDLRSKGDSWW